MTQTTFSETTLRTIEPLAERIVSLRAAAAFYVTAAEQIEAQSIDAPSMTERLRLAGLAQAKLNHANQINEEKSALLVQARAAAKADGRSLPGIDGLTVIADQYSARLFAASA